MQPDFRGKAVACVFHLKGSREGGTNQPSGCGFSHQDSSQIAAPLWLTAGRAFLREHSRLLHAPPNALARAVRAHFETK